MNCPSCNRPNKDGLVHCDYCGTPLTAPVHQKRKTEAEVLPYGGPKGAPKRVTEIESLPGGLGGAAAGGDPFDPFHVPSPSAGQNKPPLGSAGEAPKKRVTVYDPGEVADPFRSPPADRAPGSGGSGGPSVAANPNHGRRIIGWLVTFDGNPDGLCYVLREGRNVIGRAPENDIATSGDELVSGTHAFLIWRAGRARVADANTQNGTYLNDEDVLGQVEVKDNDVIRVGRTRLLVRLLDHDKVTALWKLPARGA